MWSSRGCRTAGNACCGLQRESSAGAGAGAGAGAAGAGAGAQSNRATEQQSNTQNDASSVSRTRKGTQQNRTSSRFSQ
eukprot:3723397-Rhodomonas_salina.5